MVTTVISAFDKFLFEEVNLDKDETRKARYSRDWLLKQLEVFPEKISDFPSYHEDSFINFGSFSRRTKKRPLDDIDLMVCLHADGCHYDQFGDTIKIYVNNERSPLYKLRHTDAKTLNSIRVVNKFVSSLSTVSQYKSAQIKRNQEAAVLELVSYDWVFDIVPCFLTVADASGRTYYAIPDGSGHWKLTDPRIDQQRVTQVNQNHSGNVLNVIRAIKYWQRRSTMPRMGSYLLEVMVLNYYAQLDKECSKYVDIELPFILTYISNTVISAVSDPKGIISNINTLDIFDCFKISLRASNDSKKASEARELEKAERFKESLKLWREIFGDDFPEYED